MNDREVHSDTYYIPSIIRILDEVDSSEISDEDKTVIVESIIQSNSDLTENDKTALRKSLTDNKDISKKKEKQKKLLIDNIKMLIRKTVFIVLLFYILFFHIFGFTRISNQSMAPGIAAGDLLLYYRLDKNYVSGDVVTFKREGKRYHLRVVAVEGDIISLNTDGEFLINGNLEKYTIYLKNVIPSTSKIKYPYVVPKGKVFVVGDYRSNTNDFSVFGAIDKKKIDGKIISLLQTKDI